MLTQDFMHRLLLALANIHGSLNLETTKDAVVRSVALLFGAQGASLLLFEPGHAHLRAFASFGLSDLYLSKGIIDPKTSLGELVEGRPIVIKDINNAPNIQYREAALQEGIKSIIGLPLSGGGTLVGSLRLYFSKIQNFSLEETACFQAITQQASLALRKAFAFAAIHSAVSEIHRLPDSLDSLKNTLKVLVKNAAEYGNAHGCALLLKNSTNNTLETIINYGLSESYLSKGPILISESIGEITSGEPVIISDVTTDERIQYKKETLSESLRAIIGLPIWIGVEIIGALRFYYRQPFTPDEDDLMWMDFLAQHVGVAIEKNQTLIQLKNKHDWYKGLLQDLDTPLYR